MLTAYAEELEYPLPPPEGKPLPSGIRDEVRRIMQRAYFIYPDYPEAEKGLKRAAELKKELESGGYAVTADFVETKS
ncbi:MAG: L-aspartate oxidase, partial [Lachnospiraceae bacterium]|nr:L-aspartate oxidase [Lachnospiraceae bacterium]